MKIKLSTLMKHFEQACRNEEMSGSFSPEDCEIAREQYKRIKKIVWKYCKGKKVKV